MVTLSDWNQMLIAKDLLSFHRRNNLNGIFNNAISKTERIFNNLKQEALIENSS
jgi:hypothetical protein